MEMLVILISVAAIWILTIAAKLMLPKINDLVDEKYLSRLPMTTLLLPSIEEKGPIKKKPKRKKSKKKYYLKPKKK